MVKYGNIEDNEAMFHSCQNDQFYPYRKKLGNKIKQLRLDSGLTQEELAMDVIKMNVSYLAKIENGYINTSLRYLIRIAKGLKVKVRDLIEF